MFKLLKFDGPLIMIMEAMINAGGRYLKSFSATVLERTC